MKILLVDADSSFLESLKRSLSRQRHTIDAATDGEAGWELAEAIAYDLIVLDIALPKLDGIQFCRRLRKIGSQAFVILTACQNESIVGLDAGADDYVLKPIALPELEARIRALLRRKATTEPAILERGGLRLDVDRCEVTYQNNPINLTAKEYGMLALFLQNDQRIYSQSVIISQLWSIDEETPGLETVRAHIKRLRQKLKAAGAGDLIETVYGLGYRLNSAFSAGGGQEKPTVGIGRSARVSSTAQFAAQPSLEAASRILIVDDDPFTLNLLRGILEPWGLQVATLREPLKIWQELDRLTPDLLILDIQMPDVDGIAVCQQLRQSDRWDCLPILFLTGQTDAATIQQVFTAGADDYINKPIEGEQLMTRILNRLERTRRLRLRSS
jgi:DNA-binding response OmpR family regulator